MGKGREREKSKKKKWCPLVLLPKETIPTDPCLAAYALKLVSGSPLHVTYGLVKLLLLCWDSEQMRLCTHLLRMESQFPTAFWLSHTSSPLVFKARGYGAHFPCSGPSNCGAQHGVQYPSSSGRASTVVISLLHVDRYSQGCES